jgi:hypothetical protein
VESIFGVERQLGRPTPEAIALISGILRRGMLRPAPGEDLPPA